MFYISVAQLTPGCHLLALLSLGFFIFSLVAEEFKLFIQNKCNIWALGYLVNGPKYQRS